ncbi:MAG TPA: hypothetical protein VGO33_09785, partial [Gemmatimonadaceae bacterium]|nr:hypothetical protein [Gemmatimonadaceae bacterium]
MSYLGTTYHLGSVSGARFGDIRGVQNREGMMSDKSKGYGTALLASSVAFVVVVLLSRILPFEPFLLFAVPVVL